MKRLERGLLIHSTCLLSLSPLAKVEGETGLALDRPLAVLGNDGHVADRGLGYGCHLDVISGKGAG